MDDSLAFFEIQWRDSLINPNVPRPSGVSPVDNSTESLLVADVLDLEFQVEEWRRIAAQYRELAQFCLERASAHYEHAVKITRENKALRELL